MTKIKNGETISLVREEQKKVSTETKKLKKKIELGKIKISTHAKKIKKKVKLDKIQVKGIKLAQKLREEQKRGLVYIGHIPHGFYEEEIKNFFKQFGKVTNVLVCRSSKTGNSKGYGYVEFLHPEVAQIAADSMNNYLMFKKRLIVNYVPAEKRPKGIFHNKGKLSSENRIPTKIRREKQFSLNNSDIEEKTHLKRSSNRLKLLSKKLSKLEKFGIKYDFEPTNQPEPLKKQTEKPETCIYDQDSCDSDIEFKVPVKIKPLKATTMKLSTPARVLSLLEPRSKKKCLELDTSVDSKKQLLKANSAEMRKKKTRTFIDVLKKKKPEDGGLIKKAKKVIKKTK